MNIKTRIKKDIAFSPYSIAIMAIRWICYITYLKCIEILSNFVFVENNKNVAKNCNKTIHKLRSFNRIREIIT